MQEESISSCTVLTATQGSQRLHDTEVYHAVVNAASYFEARAIVIKARLLP